MTRYDRGGGLLTYGIPGFKLEKDVVERRIQRLEDSGIKFVQHARRQESDLQDCATRMTPC
jgi:NADPH-dependent glutamate synthase beta subunit-like oxidoreductase